MDVIAKLNALAAAPKTHACVVTYADGRERRTEFPFESMARACAGRERVKAGKNLIDRATGKAVRIVSVEVIAI